MTGARQVPADGSLGEERFWTARREREWETEALKYRLWILGVTITSPLAAAFTNGMLPVHPDEMPLDLRILLLPIYAVVWVGMFLFCLVVATGPLHSFIPWLARKIILGRKDLDPYGDNEGAQAPKA